MTHPYKKYAEWPKSPTKWVQKRLLFVSIPLTWNLLRSKIAEGILLSLKIQYPNRTAGEAPA